MEVALELLSRCAHICINFNKQRKLKKRPQQGELHSFFIFFSSFSVFRPRIVGLGVADHSCDFMWHVCVFPVFYISLRSQRNLNIIYVQSSLFFSVGYWPPVLEVRFGSVRFSSVLVPPKWRTIHPSKRLSLAPLSPPRLSSCCSASSAPSSPRHRLFCLSAPVPSYTIPIRSHSIRSDPIGLRYDSSPFTNHSAQFIPPAHRHNQAVQLSWDLQFWEIASRLKRSCI